MPRLGCQRGGSRRWRPQLQELPRYRGETILWELRPGLGGGRKAHRDPGLAPRGLPLPEGRARVPDEGDYMLPALGVCLAHEVGLQFGHHNADDPDKDEKFAPAGQRAWATEALSRRPRDPILPSTRAHCSSHHLPTASPPRWRRGWAMDYEPVIHVGVPGPTAGAERDTGPGSGTQSPQPQCSTGSPIHKDAK